MKHTLNKSRSAIGIAFALTLLTSIPLGATPPPTTPCTTTIVTSCVTTFNLTDVEGESLAGVYTSPYWGNVGGAAGSTATIPVICDDFSDNSYIPESWTTNVTTLATIDSSSSPLSYLKWNMANSGSVATSTSGDPITVNSTSYAGWNLTQSQAYTVAAILTLEILQQNNPSDPTSPINNNPDPSAPQQQKDLSFALWELFDPTAAAGAVGANANWGTNSDSVLTWGSLPVGDLVNATNDLETAIYDTNQSVLNGYSVTIYSYNGPPVGSGLNPTCPNSSGSVCPSAPPQEFITLSTGGPNYVNHSVPEPSSLAALGGYFLFGGGSLVVWGRRRLLRSDS